LRIREIKMDLNEKEESFSLPSELANIRNEIKRKRRCCKSIAHNL